MQLATCSHSVTLVQLGVLLGENKLHKAYYILKDCESSMSKYKFAFVCLRLQKYPEAEKALLVKTLNKSEVEVVGGAAGYYLLGNSN